MPQKDEADLLCCLTMYVIYCFYNYLVPSDRMRESDGI